MHHKTSHRLVHDVRWNTKRWRKLIPQVRSCMPEWAFCDLEIWLNWWVKESNQLWRPCGSGWLNGNKITEVVWSRRLQEFIYDRDDFDEQANQWPIYYSIELLKQLSNMMCILRGDWKCQTWNCRTWKYRTWIARHDKYRMKIDYITLECAFLLNFNLLYVRRVYVNVQKT